MLTTITKLNKQVIIGKQNDGICHASFFAGRKLIHTITLQSYKTVLEYANLFFKSTVGVSTMPADLQYFTDGIFTKFVANTKSGEAAYNELHRVLGDGVALLTAHLKPTLHQLRKAGYSVKKLPKSKMTIKDISDDDLLNLLGA